MVKQREELINEIKKYFYYKLLNRLRIDNTRLTTENLACKNEIESLRSELSLTKTLPSLSIIENPWGVYANVDFNECIKLNSVQVMTYNNYYY